MKQAITIANALELALAGTPLTLEQALDLDLATKADTDALCDAADRVRLQHMGNEIHTCSIVNARSGRCSEDCKWCSQSRFHATGIDEYEYIPREELHSAYALNQSHGVQRFSLVTSGRSMPAAHMDRFCRMFSELKEMGTMQLCASMGLLSAEQLHQLRLAGVTRYHCNLETADDFFPTLCTTHTQADKLATLQAARAEGMELCVGGIIGMGENMRQRLRLAEMAREAGASAIPINILNPIAGTPLADTPALPDREIVRTVALMRFIAPKLTLHFAGGRARLSQSTVARMLRGGANGVMVGDLLTTAGPGQESDAELIQRCGYTGGPHPVK